VRNGHIKRITDQDIQSSVLEIMSSNVNTTFIKCPADPAQTLGIKLPFLVMIIKNLKKYFSFEVTVLDDKGVKRRFRASNYQVSLTVQCKAVFGQQEHGTVLAGAVPAVFAKQLVAYVSWRWRYISAQATVMLANACTAGSATQNVHCTLAGSAVRAVRRQQLLSSACQQACRPVPSMAKRL
jgi:hypothetical protein